MIAIDEAYVDSAAPNAEAVKNGRGLVLKNKFLELHISEDDTILFGECQGSGKEPYRCSSDFARPGPADAPLQLSEPAVSVQALPRPDVRLRAGQEVHRRRPCPRTCRPSARSCRPASRRKQDDADKPRQVNKGALAKKIKAQLDGIDILERLTHDLVRLGIGNMNAKLAQRNGRAGQAARQRLSARAPRPPCTATPSSSPATTASSPSNPPPSANASTARPSISSAGCTPSSSRAGPICSAGSTIRS